MIRRQRLIEPSGKGAAHWNLLKWGESSATRDRTGNGREWKRLIFLRSRRDTNKVFGLIYLFII